MKKKTAISLDVKYVISYLFILILPVMGIIASSTVFIKMYSESLLNTNEALSRQIKGDIESSLGMVEQFANDISRKQQVLSLLNVEELSPRNIYDISKFIETAQKTYSVNKCIYDYFIYYPEGNWVLSSQSLNSLEDYWLLRQFPQEDYSGIEEVLDQVHRKTLVSVPMPSRGPDSSALFYLQSTQIENNGKFANIVFVVDMERILAQANQSHFFEDGFFCIETVDGGLVYSHNLPDESLLLRDFNKRELIQVSEKEGWTVSTLRSGRFRWVYYLGIPMDSFVKQLEMMKLFCFLVVILTLIVGLALSLYFMKVNARPLDDLSDILQGYTASNVPISRDALQNIRNCSLSIIERNQQFQEIIERQLPIVRNNLFNRLILLGPDAELLTSLKETGVSFEYPYFYVLKIRSETALHLTLADLQGLEQQLLFFLPDVFRFRCFFAEVNPGHYALILNYNGTETDPDNADALSPEAVRQLMCKFFQQQSLCQKVGQIGISQRFSLLTELPRYWNQADIALETAVYGKRKSCCFQEIVFECDIPVFPRAEQEQWVGEIASGKSEEAKARICAILDTRLRDQLYQPQLMDRRIHEFREAVLGCLRSVNDSRMKKILPTEQLESQLYSCDPTILEGRIYELLNLFSGYIMGKELPKNQNVYIEQATVYVQEHYMDPGLSLSQAAEVFNLSYTYLAHIFKAEMGCSFMDYVRKVRIEKVVRLLAVSPKNISQLAHDVGYSDINAFNRNFKKVMLMTPSEYRKMVYSVKAEE